MLVIVYGMLKRGFPNHDLIEDQKYGKAEFVSNGVTADRYPLSCSGDYVSHSSYAQQTGRW